MTNQKQYPDGIKIQVFNYATIENLKPFELTGPVEKQPSNLGMLLVHLQKKLRILRPCQAKFGQATWPKK